MLILLEKPWAHAGNEWDSSRVGVGKHTRVPSSKYMHYIPQECMYVSRVNGRIISMVLKLVYYMKMG